MGRKYGRLNKYNSQLRRCARSGLRFYQNDMLYIDGKWIHPKFVDEDEGLPRGRRSKDMMRSQ